jgi:membrane protein
MAEFWSLRGLSWGELAKRTCRKSWEDEVFGQSARLAFYFFFAMFPVLLLLVILLGRPTGVGSELLGVLLDSSQQVLPPDASGLVANTTRQLNVRAVLGAGAIVLLGNFNLSEIMGVGVAQKSKSDSPSQC